MGALAVVEKSEIYDTEGFEHPIEPEIELNDA